MSTKNQPIKRTGNALTIIAGPCSIGEKNVDDIYKIAEIKVDNGQRAIFGTRVVGLKSRTSFNKKGQGMGIDHQVFMKNLEIFFKERTTTKLKMLPSIIIAKKIIKDTNMMVATEIVSPLTQLPLFERIIPQKKLLVWNPAVNQLGWPILEMGQYAKKNNWYIGLKNGKWADMENNWLGLMEYARMSKTEMKQRLIFIQRGINVPNKNNYRNVPVHKAAERIKKLTNAQMFFDPSHSLGPKLRHKITDTVVEAMRMKCEGTYLYDGVLIEVGHSQTDTDQHLSVRELDELCQRLANFRTLVAPR